jgi:hypothetical protein
MSHVPTLWKSVPQPNTREQCNLAFAEGGEWDRNRGREQTRRFTEHFLKHATIPKSEFTMLDVGCALGDGILLCNQRYPNARLFGCDVSEVAIRRCRGSYGHLAEFFVAGFEEVQGSWDVIFCSNVLEHFEQHLEIAATLLGHCSILYVMTPFAELSSLGRPLRGADGGFHVATFYTDSFEPLVARGLASEIETQIFPVPGAWGYGRLRRLRRLARGLLTNRPIEAEPLQILYTIHRAQSPEAPPEGRT